MKPQDTFKKYITESKELLNDMYKTKEYINTVSTDLSIDEYILISDFLDETATLIIATIKNKTPLKQKYFKQLRSTLDTINSTIYKKIDLDIVDYYYFKKKL